MSSNGVAMGIGPHTRFIISTSGRLSSLKRYKCLLQDILKIDIAYIPIHSGSSDKPAIEAERFIGTIKGLPCIGGAISRDIKHTVVPYMDELDESAEAVQSVNTVIITPEGKLRGYNTDVLGFRRAIEDGIRVSGLSVATAVCYGSGGVTSVVIAVLQQLGIKVCIAGRNLATVAARCKELNVEVWKGETVDLFVNATPGSEHPLHEAPNFLEALKGCKMAFDHEMPGRYLREHCQQEGIVHLPGENMYYPQMEVQWGLFLKGLVDQKDIKGLIEQADRAKDAVYSNV